MELRHLRDFVAVAEELSFTRAAARLHLTQPALSRRVQQLEQEVGARLLDRRPSGVTLTEAGAMFLRDARRMLDLSVESVRAVQALKETGRRSLRVGYTRHLHYHLLPQALAEYSRAWPAVDVSLHTMSPAELLFALDESSLDVGFLLEVPGLRGSCVAMYPSAAAVPREHPLATRERVRLEDFHDELLIVLSDAGYPGARERVLRHWADTGGEPRVVEAVDRFEDAMGFVAAGLGSALLPEQASLFVDPDRAVIRRFEVPPRFALWMACDERGGGDHVDGFVKAVGRVREGVGPAPFFGAAG